MKLLENEELQRMVDYSFGDHSGVLGGVPNAFMNKANVNNMEFQTYMVSRVDNKKPITLFIDNIRLYRRPIGYSDWLHMKPVSEQDRQWLNQFDDEDLLELCRIYKHFKFVIFTAFEDTPLDEYINVPDNVTIYAANAVVFNEKIHPFPHGIERIMYEGYNHHELLEEALNRNVEPYKGLLVCHRDDTGARGSIKDMFKDKDWATVAPKLEYEDYLQAIQDHKFVLCPSGNGIESARNWETLYMKRVPIFKRHPYLEEMFKDFPALFVDEWEEVTEELLAKHDYLYEEAQKMDMNKLSLDYWFNKATS